MIGDVAANSPLNAAVESPENHKLEKECSVCAARKLHQKSSTNIRTLQDHVLQYTSQYRTHEDLVLSKIKDGITVAREHRALSAGIAITAGLLLMRGPRRFLVRRTYRLFETEEERKIRANKDRLILAQSLERLEVAVFGVKEISYSGELRNSRSLVKSVDKSFRKIEGQANDLVDDLREISGLEALQTRQELADWASGLKEVRLAMNKSISIPRCCMAWFRCKFGGSKNL